MTTPKKVIKKSFGRNCLFYII